MAANAITTPDLKVNDVKTELLGGHNSQFYPRGQKSLYIFPLLLLACHSSS